MKNHKTELPEENPLQRVLLSEQKIALTSVPNIRELGGYENIDGMKIKRRKLILPLLRKEHIVKHSISIKKPISGKRFQNFVEN